MERVELSLGKRGIHHEGHEVHEGEERDGDFYYLFFMFFVSLPQVVQFGCLGIASAHGNPMS